MAKSVLKAASREVTPSSFLDYKLYLQSLYSLVKSRVDHYTYQKFADDLGFGATTIMHQVIRGYRPLTTKASEKIIKSLQLQGPEKLFLKKLIEYANAKTAGIKESKFEELLSLKSNTLPEAMDQDMLEYFSTWYHPVIREMVAMKDFKHDPKWVADKLVPAVKPEEAKRSLKLLENLGMIYFDADAKRYKQCQTVVNTGPRVKGMGLLRYHQKMIDHGRAALTAISGKRRNISAVTVSCDEETAAKIKSMINMFQLKIVEEAEKGKKQDQIYQVNFQLFPFTKTTSGEKS